MSQLEEDALCSLFQRLKQTEIEDFDRATYAGLATDAAKLECLQALSRDLQDAVDTKEQEIADLESEVDDLRAVETALQTVAHRVKLRLGIDLVEGQLPLPPTATKPTESEV